MNPLSLTNPWVIIGAIVIVGTVGAGGYYYGGKHTENELVAEFEKQKNKAVMDAVKAAKTQAAADYKLNTDNADKVHKAQLEEAHRNVKVIREIRSNTVYRDADCAIPDSGLQLIRDAARGGADPALPARTGDGKAVGSTP